MPERSDLSELLRRHRVLICVGSGGVGKTTVAAALSLLAARRGLRTLCLTIDPARRLASSLGISAFPREELQISDEFLNGHGVKLAAPLKVMMLDAQATFDSLIQKFASTPAAAAKICQHRVYRHLSENLAATQAYMAMEKVLEVIQDESYDLIVLDTPPSAQALAFFDAPQKMSEILASPATRALSRVVGAPGVRTGGVLASGLRHAMKALERVTGAGLIVEVSELISQMSSLLQGFEERAERVQSSLRSEAFGYVVVTTPSQVSLHGARDLGESMRSRELKLDAVVFNRVAQDGLFDATPEDTIGAPLDDLVGLTQAARRVIVERAHAQAKQHRRDIERCEQFLSELDPSVLAALLPAFADDVHQPERLMHVGELLVGEQSYFAPLARKYRRSGTES